MQISHLFYCWWWCYYTNVCLTVQGTYVFLMLINIWVFIVRFLSFQKKKCGSNAIKACLLIWLLSLPISHKRIRRICMLFAKKVKIKEQTNQGTCLFLCHYYWFHQLWNKIKTKTAVERKRKTIFEHFRSLVRCC